MLMELIGDILPAGVLNIVTGFGAEAGQALATSKRMLNFHSLVLRRS
jgi:aldehyde dehydrogenase (NAD+)/aldehyde dehydrogenase